MLLRKSCPSLSFCQVKVKTCIKSQAHQQDLEKLRFETCIHARLAEHDESFTRGAGLPPPLNSKRASVKPHLQELADWRLALIMPDYNGIQVLRHVASFWKDWPEAKEVAELPPPHPLVHPPPFEAITVASVREALRVAIGIVVECKELHKLGLVHGGLAPPSLAFHAGSGSVQFLCLTRASIMHDRAEVDINSLQLRERWLYASPEQSGKIEKPLDGRSDQYSIGQ
jgi:hypothetical protein